MVSNFNLRAQDTEVCVVANSFLGSSMLLLWDVVVAGSTLSGTMYMMMI
jgi:hypothetical protein